jgi:signal transduction histidine kinase/ligand-binding sensor domain-containing protein
MKRRSSPSVSATTHFWVNLRRRLRASIWLALLLFACFSRGVALDPHQSLDQLYHSVWGAKQGITGAVAALAQTTDGYLWLGTEDGLLRFDGTSFERYEPESGTLPANSVSALMAVPDGGLWVGFFAGGASFLKNGNVVSYTDAQGFPVSMVRAFARDGTGAIWAAAIGGLARLEGKKWHRVHKEWNYPTKSARAIFADRDGNLWVATGSAIVVLPKGGESYRDTGIKCGAVSGITQAIDGSIIFDDEAEKKLRAIRRDPTGNVTELHEIHAQSGVPFVDRDGALWVAANGISRIPFLSWRDSGSQKTEQLTATQGLTSDTTTQVIEDHEGNIWVSTAGGLDQFRYRNVTWFPLPSVNFGLVEGSDGEVWAGSGGNQRYTFSRVLDGKIAGPGTKTIYAIFRDRDGSVWFSERNALIHWQHNQFIQVTPPLSVVSMSRSTHPSDPIIASSITSDRSGALWVAFGGSGEYRLKNGNWTFVPVLPDHPDWAANCAFTDNSDRIWLCWGDRVAQLNHGSVRVFGEKEGLSVGPFHLVSGDNREIWIGGEQGLAMFDGKRFHTIQTSTNTGFRSVTGIVATQMNDLWLSAASGIAHVPQSEIEFLRNNPDHKVRFDSFDMITDLPDSPMWAGVWSSAALQTKHGILWFATLHGAARVDPSQIYKNLFPPPVNISSISADDKEFSVHPYPILPALTQTIVIRYDGLSLTVPERVRFQYKLDGWDHEWHEVGGRRQAFFTHLAPGKYTFHVIACNNDGVWNRTGATLAFTVAPAWYQTYWFFALCAATGMTILWILYVLRLRSIARTISARFDERLAERTRIARDLHDTFLQTIQGSKMVADDALDFSSDPVRTRNALQQLSGWLDRATKESRAALHSLRLSATTRNDLAEALQRACDHAGHSTSMGVTFSVVGDSREMHPIFRDEVYRIAYEAIRNAYKHSNGTRLEIELRYGQELSVTVRDNGVGIDPGVGDGSTDHFGLQGMRERAARIRGKLTIISSSGSGTRVTLTVPGAIAFSDARPGLLRSLKTNLMYFFRRW